MVVQNVNELAGKRHFRRKGPFCRQKTGLTDTIGDISFDISPRSFFPVNERRAAVYEKVREWATSRAGKRSSTSTGGAVVYRFFSPPGQKRSLQSDHHRQRRKRRKTRSTTASATAASRPVKLPGFSLNLTGKDRCGSGDSQPSPQGVRRRTVAASGAPRTATDHLRFRRPPRPGAPPGHIRPLRLLHEGAPAGGHLPPDPRHGNRLPAGQGIAFVFIGRQIFSVTRPLTIQGEIP